MADITKRLTNIIASTDISITVYRHGNTSKSWKVIMILEELNLPYETEITDSTQLKSEPYTSINPNGRLPAIKDPNTGLTLWESGAIIEYLVETYDKDHQISFTPGSTEYFHAKQYLHFQMSGQGPYFGQAIWFRMFHPEKIASAEERILAGKEYLVGKFSYVDVPFVPWYGVVEGLFADEADLGKDFPIVRAWLDRVQARSAIAKVLKMRDEVAAAEN
ncbi:thioredoxin-like protein [Aspergillus aurantiobrunneus]